MAGEPVPGSGPETTPAAEIAEPLYRIILKMVLALVVILIVAFVAVSAAYFLKIWLFPANANISSDTGYMIGLLNFLTLIIICGAMLLAAMYLIAGRDWKAFLDKTGLRPDRRGRRLFLAGALLGVASFGAIIIGALLAGSLIYAENGISQMLMIMNGEVFAGNPGLIDRIPFLALAISAAMFLALALAIGLGEVALLYGYLQRSLTGKYGAFAAITAIGLLFAAATWITGATILEIVNSFFTMILIGYLYRLTGSILAPAGFNFATAFLMAESFPSGFYSVRLLYFFFNQPLELAGISFGEGYYVISIVVSIILLVLMLYYSEKRKEQKEAQRQ